MISVLSEVAGSVAGLHKLLSTIVSSDRSQVFVLVRVAFTEQLES
jgi:hypothetical protein